MKMNMLKEDEKPEDTSVDMENGKVGTYFITWIYFALG